MFCYYCGKENKDGAAFCTHCGKALRTGKQPAGKAPVPRKKSRGLLIGLVLAMILLLAGGTIGALVYFGGEKASAGREVPEIRDDEAEVSGEETEPEMLTVPDVANETQENALNKLGDAGFQELRVEEIYDEAVPAGAVIAVSAEAGEELEAGTALTVYVSLGREPVELVDVTGETESHAQAALLLQGMAFRAVYEYSQDVEEGRVISQSPQAGTMQTSGTEVTVVVSMGREAVSAAGAGDYRVNTGHISYYVPAGFETVQNSDGGCTIWQELYNPELEMTILVSGYTTEDMGCDPADQLAYDADNFDTTDRSVTYERDEEDWFVRSGYLNDTGEIYYVREIYSEGDPDLLLCLYFAYSPEHKDQCDGILTTFIENLK